MPVGRTVPSCQTVAASAEWNHPSSAFQAVDTYFQSIDNQPDSRYKDSAQFLNFEMTAESESRHPPVPDHFLHLHPQTEVQTRHLTVPVRQQPFPQVPEISLQNSDPLTGISVKTH